MNEEQGWINTDGSFGESLDAAPDSVKTVIEKKGFKNVEDVVTSYTNLESMKGDWSNPNSIKLPAELTAEHKAQINTALGVPDSVDGYTYDGELDLKDPGIQKFMEISHGVGKTQAQINTDLDFYKGLLELGQEEQKLAQEAQQEVLKTTYGDNLDSVLETTDAIAKKLGVSDQIKSEGLDRNPAVLNILNMVAKKTEEGTILGNNNESGEESVKEQLAAIQKDPAFTNAMDPRHKEVVLRSRQLLGIG